MAKVVEARRSRKKASKSLTTQVNNNLSPYLVVDLAPQGALILILIGQDF